MHFHIDRRQFLARTIAAVGSTFVSNTIAESAELSPAVVRREGQARFRLGLAAYSFRAYMKFSSHGSATNPTDPARQMDMFEFVDYAADQGCDGAELTSYYFPPDVSDQYLADLRRHAFLRGLDISGSAVGNNFALPDGPELDEQIMSVNRWIDRCSLLGAPHVRVFAGAPKNLDLEQSVSQCVKSLRKCADHASERGVMLGLENHGGIVSDAKVLERIVNEVNHDWVRINLDTGNFYSDHPYEDLARLAPYAVNVQFKVEINRVPGGHSPANLPREIEILKHAGYQGYVTLEYESEEDPYTAVPRHLSRLRRALLRSDEV